jgi:hypothetical protein
MRDNLSTWLQPQCAAAERRQIGTASRAEPRRPRVANPVDLGLVVVLAAAAPRIAPVLRPLSTFVPNGLTTGRASAGGEIAQLKISGTAASDEHL